MKQKTLSAYGCDNHARMWRIMNDIEADCSEPVCRANEIRLRRWYNDTIDLINEVARLRDIIRKNNMEV